MLVPDVITGVGKSMLWQRARVMGHMACRCNRLKCTRLDCPPACKLPIRVIITPYLLQVYSVTVMTHVIASEAGHSSQGTSEPITPVY